VLAPDGGQDMNMTSEQAFRVIDHLREAPAAILQGPPGAGKTRLALEVVQALVAERASGAALPAQGAWQDFRWTNLVGDHVDPAASALVARNQEQILEAPIVWEIVQLHPGYSYEDLVRGLASTHGGGTGFVPHDRIVLQLAEAAIRRAEDAERTGREVGPTVLILDEINRCNLSAVLGELILVLEGGYRDFDVRLQYPAAEGARSVLRLPKNFWIIGTMNTADRSIAMVDFAIRRRFRFLDVLPSREVVARVNPEPARDGATRAFDAFRNLVRETDRDRLAIGHSYFLVPGADTNDWAGRLAKRIVFEVLPLVREYAEEGFLDKQPVQKAFWDRFDPRGTPENDQVLLGTVERWLSGKA
jgi:MoxR-like ATPase